MNKIDENNTADRSLVDRVINGDVNAFSIIIRNTERLTAQIVFKMVRNAEDRKDVAQEVYIKAYKNLESFQFKSRLSTWIGRIAYTTCLNYLKKKKLLLLNDSGGHDTDEPNLIDEIPGVLNPGPEEVIIGKELSEILSSEIDNLQPIYSTLITLYHNEELSYSEITQITELPEGTVKNYLFRARKKLRENLLLNYTRDIL